MGRTAQGQFPVYVNMTIFVFSALILSPLDWHQFSIIFIVVCVRCQIMSRTSPVSDRDRNFDRYRDRAGIGPFLPVPGLTDTGIGDKTESARIRPGLTFRHRDLIC